ncbi:MAG: hypothetical protein ACT4OU_05690 [Hyphomicrobium sp.]
MRHPHDFGCGFMTLAAGLALASAMARSQAPPACGKADFEVVVEEAAGALRDLNQKNKPSFQEKLKALKDQRGWSHDQFMKEAAPFVRDEKIAVYDQSTDDLLSAISSLGAEGATAASPDCALLLELRARMKLLVETQSAKWTYMFDKIGAELAR